jgi:hypothetical protein
MNTNDPKLSEVLHRWRALEPSAGFEMRVRRRLAAPDREPSPMPWLQPVSALAAILLAAFVASRGTASVDHAIPRGSLTASYVQLTSGERP